MVQRQVTVLSLMFAMTSLIYGYLTLTMASPPYGELTRPLGLMSMAAGFIVMGGQFRYLKRLHL